MTGILPQIIERLQRSSVKFEIHRFDSGAVTVDIWIREDFYVIDIENKSIALSLITPGTTTFDTVPDVFTYETVFWNEFKKILPIDDSIARKTLIIDGNNFKNLEEFHLEIDRILTKDLTWETGHNLDAFNDLLRGGFGVHDYEEPIILLWENSEKSRKELVDVRDNESIYDLVVSIIRDHKHIDFVEK